MNKEDATAAAWSDLLAAAGRLIELDPDATSHGRRIDLFTVAIWPAGKHDLDGYRPDPSLSHF